MFYFFSKFLIFTLRPINWLFVAFLFLVIKKTAKRKIFLLLLILIYFSHNQFISRNLYHLWSYKPIAYENLKKSYKVGILLGGVIEKKPHQIQNSKLYVDNYSERIFRTIELYKKKHIDKILITGQSQSLLYGQYFESQNIKDFLLLIEIPENDIFIETQARNTHENALYSAKLLKKMNISFKDCLLITSSFHMRRAEACFNKIGCKIDVFPTDYKDLNTSIHFWEYPKAFFVLTSQSASNIYLVLHEIIGYWVYYLKGYI